MSVSQYPVGSFILVKLLDNPEPYKGVLIGPCLDYDQAAEVIVCKVEGSRTLTVLSNQFILDIDHYKNNKNLR